MCSAMLRSASSSWLSSLPESCRLPKARRNQDARTHATQREDGSSVQSPTVCCQWSLHEVRRRRGASQTPAQLGESLRTAKMQSSEASLPHSATKSALEDSIASQTSHESRVGGQQIRMPPLVSGVLASIMAIGVPFAPFPTDVEVVLPLSAASSRSNFLSTLGDAFRGRPAPAYASGLLQMPPVKLNNDYYLVRAGESEWEANGIIHTNPVDKTNIQSGLSEAGKKQAVAAARLLERLEACDYSCWIWPSISQRSYQTAEVIAYVNGLSYSLGGFSQSNATMSDISTRAHSVCSRIVPEYSFLDARGMGSYENLPISSMTEVYDADSVSERIRPPPTTDGTPSESVHDVFVRVRQMMSIIETQYSGETIVVISPDSDNLSVLQAALTGLDLRSHHLLQFSSGEVRHLELPEDLEREKPISGMVKLI